MRFIIWISSFLIGAGAWANPHVERCVLDICGSKDLMLSASGLGSFRNLPPSSVASAIASEIDPLMNQIVAFDITRTRANLIAIQTLERILNPATLTDDEWVYLTWVDVQGNKWDIISPSIKVDSAHKYSVDHKVLANVLPGKSASEIIRLSNVFEALLNGPSWDIFTTLQDMPFDLALKYLDVQPDKIHEYTAGLFSSLLGNVISRYGVIALPASSLAVLSKATGPGVELNAIEKKEWVEAVSELHKFKGFLEGPEREALLKNRIDLRSFSIPIKNTAAKLGAILNSPKALNQLQSKMLTQCRGKIASYLGSGLGAGVLAHELGHVVSRSVNLEKSFTPFSGTGWQLRKEPNVFQCLSDRQVRFYEVADDGANNQEDWSDTFSESVKKELHSEWPHARNFGCMLFEFEEEKESFKKNFVNLALKETGHSSGIYRLLHLEAAQGPLPASCLSLPELKDKTIISCGK